MKSGSEAIQGSGRLYIVATPIGNLGDMSDRAREILSVVDVIACEDTRRTRKLISAFQLGSSDRMVSFHEHNEIARTNTLIQSLREGLDVALVCDAGTPTISDPGFRLIDAAHDQEIEVTAIPGPSASVTALAMSGFACFRFCFEGFLPTKKSTRLRRLKEIDQDERPTIVFESPYRITRTISSLHEALGSTRRVFIAKEISKLHETTWRGTLGELDPFGPDNAKGEFVIVVEGNQATKAHGFNYDEAEITLP